jgi:hypothetical protein
LTAGGQRHIDYPSEQVEEGADWLDDFGAPRLGVLRYFAVELPPEVLE